MDKYNQLLGQHFLTNRLAIKKIIDALELEKDDIIIEIGPGRGALTLPLAKTCQEIGCRVAAVEKDQKLGSELGYRVWGLGFRKDNLEIITGDILKLLPEITKPYTLNPIPYKVTGNIPYYITGRLLRILSELENKPELTVLTIQKEVAERITAKPPRMNLLSAITQFWAEPEIIAFLKPADFNPPPKVDSAIIRLGSRVWGMGFRDKKITNYSAKGGSASGGQFPISNYGKFVRTLFKQPRKTIFNNLRFGFKLKPEKIEKILEKYRLSGVERPQNLSLELLIKLAAEFSGLGVL